MKRFYPLNIDLTNQLCIVVGAGQVAARKIRMLLPYSPRIIVIAKQIRNPVIESYQAEGKIKVILSSFRFSLLKNAFFVIAATDDRELNTRIAHRLMKKNRLVNNVNGDGNIILPAVYNDDPITIAVSTNGKSPSLAQAIRNKIANFYLSIKEKNHAKEI